MSRLRTAARPLKPATLMTLAAILSCAEVREDSRAAALTSLIESERAFARSAAELGTRDAFLAFLADEALLFRPRALNGKEWLTQQPPTPGLLSWEPRHADIAASADLGFTFGPWEYRPEGADRAVARGYYFSVWCKQPDGAWKVVIDHGTASGPSAEDAALETGSVRETAAARVVSIAPQAARSELLEADAAFAAAVRAASSAGGLDRFVSEHTRLLRDGQPPQLAGSLSSLESAWPTPMLWKVLGGDVASSGTFGYSFGEYEIHDSVDELAIEEGNYLRTWRRENDGSWRVLADLMSPVPGTRSQ